jgi:hypothetical protein
MQLWQTLSRANRGRRAGDPCQNLLPSASLSEVRLAEMILSSFRLGQPQPATSRAEATGRAQHMGKKSWTISPGSLLFGCSAEPILRHSFFVPRIE